MRGFHRIQLAVWGRGRRRRREVIRDGRRRREGRRREVKRDGMRRREGSGGAARGPEDTTGSDFKGPAATGLYTW